MIRFCAIRIEGTGNYDRDWLARFSDWSPRLWDVLIVRPGQPSYVASLTPSSLAMHAYTHGELSMETPPEIGERLDSDLRSIVHVDAYLDFKTVQEIVSRGENVRDLGLFKTRDESLSDCQDAWETALDFARNSRPL